MQIPQPATDLLQSGGSPSTVSESDLIRERRKKAGLVSEPEVAAPPSALALSGGGIRSATFCLGLVRALAKNKVFHTFDYLSTVSGGGYVGSAIARLHGPQAGRDARSVEEGLARDNSVLLWWLRSNGRYLTPNGRRDLTQAFASVFRGVLSTHFEVGMLLVVAATLMLAPYVLMQYAAAGGWLPAWTASFRNVGLSFWWWATVVPGFLALHHIFAYWFWRSPSTASASAVDAAVAAAGAYLFWKWLPGIREQLRDVDALLVPALSAAACLLLVAPLTAFVHRWLNRGTSLAAARLMHTKQLAGALWTLLWLVLIGLLDWGTWLLAATIAAGLAAAVSVPSAAAIIALAQRLLPYLDKAKALAKTGSKQRLTKAAMVNLLGLVLLLLVLVIWTTGVQWFSSPDHPWAWLDGATGLTADNASLIPKQWLGLALAPLLYVLITSTNLELLNLSSLHNFYRARIERAYVSTGNANRFVKGILVPTQGGNTDLKEMELAEARPGDDVDIAEHRPHEYGGPIHLVNCCINQTEDDRTGSYNADRKGVCLTVSALGAEKGTGQPMGAPVPGRLSMWAAISGAAASSGMGSQTSPGLAALMFLSGLRLGYWHAAISNPTVPDERKLLRAELIRSEAMARFPGLRSPQWYLSDGGHFDNTGVYALLKRRLRLVVLADCGADPLYQFEDLENLVRKAKIDYATHINFMVPPTSTTRMAAGEAELRAAIGLPHELGERKGDKCILLGQIAYGDSPAGILVVVKPRLTTGMSLDLEAYARSNLLFPQQGTGDQFFDEAQWEGYHQLGVHLGRLLTVENLALMQSWVSGAACNAPSAS